MVLGAVSKQPAEVLTLSIDFTRDLVGGETISSAVVTVKNLATGADSSNTIKLGSHTTSGAVVSQMVQAGTDGEDHRMQIRVTTSASNVYEHEIDLSIREA